MSEETVQLDQIIPDFTAKATIKPFKLSDYKGKNLIIYFYPKDNTPGCTAESIDFREYYPEFQKANTEIVGLSRTVCVRMKTSRKNSFAFSPDFRS